MDTEESVKIPQYFNKLHKFVILTSDVMFVNLNLFMITSAKKIEFATVGHIPSQTDEQISKILNKVINLYGRGGFIIHVILMDLEFEKVANLMVNVEVKISAAR